MLCAPAVPESHQQNLYAFSFRLSQPTTAEQDGWNLYKPIEEYARLSVPSAWWRYTTLNQQYELCPTYPRHLVVPAAADDDLLLQVAKFRSRSRLPVLSWLHARTHGVICRAAQPNTGPFGRRSTADEELLR